MKKIYSVLDQKLFVFLFILSLLVASQFTFAQAPPQGINYQAVAIDPNGKEIIGVDINGQLIAEKAIAIRFSIITGTINGPIEYQEEHSTNTDSYGMFSLIIGMGKQTGGTANTFSNINWGSDAHFLQVAIDIAGGTNFKLMGTQQMMSVPYALYATSSGTGTPGPAGAAGQSAYEVWLSLGNTGTSVDFISSLTGPTGNQGVAGPAGQQGATGAQGIQGLQGNGLTIVGNVNTASNLPSAYTGNIGDGYIVSNTGNLWIWDGAQWNDVGPIVGPAGANGLSAYDIWLSLGNTGTQAAFIGSLTGPQGIAGAQGATGAQGQAGPQGVAGAAGAPGSPGQAGSAGTNGTNGISIVWLGSFTVAPSSPALNQGYYNSTDGKSYIWNGSSWQMIAQDGGAGAGGNTLDMSYNQGGSGAGRVISANNGAVTINQSGSSTVGLQVNSTVANSTAIYANQNAAGVAIRAESTSPSNQYAAIQASSNSTGAQNAAIVGNNDGAGYAIAGQVPSTASGASAIYGSNLRTAGGNGVEGIGFNGVIGQGQNGQGFGLYGINNGVADGVTALGVGTYGIGFNGVYGQTNDPANGWSGYFTEDLGVEGTGYSFGGWQTVSDKRFKTNIIPINGALAKLKLINGTHYTLTTKKTEKITLGKPFSIKEKQKEQYGVIAQELEKVFPEMVTEKAIYKNMGDDTLYKTVDYTQLIPVLLEAIKELQIEIDILKAK